MFSGFIRGLVLVGLIGAAVACSKKQESKLVDGFYVSADTTAPLPIAAVASDGSQTYSYGVSQSCGSAKFSRWGSVANYKSGTIPGKTLTEYGGTPCTLDWSVSPVGDGLLISYTKDGVAGSVYLSSVSRVDFLKEFKKYSFPAGRQGNFTSAESSFCSDLMGMTCTEWFALFPAP